MRQWRSVLSFYSTCTAPYALSVVRTVPLSIPILLFDQKCMRLTRSTKDRKKRGVLMIQVHLTNRVRLKTRLYGIYS